MNKRLFKIVIIFFLIPINFWYANFEIKTKYDNAFSNIKRIVWDELKATEKIDQILNEKKEKSGKNKEIIDDFIRENNEKYFSIIMSKEENIIKNEIEKHKALKDFKNKLLNSSRIVKENGIWYWYIYKDFSFFPEKSHISESDLIYNKIDKNNHLVSFKEWKIIFIKNYKKYRLVSDEIIYWIAGKKELLENLINIKNFDNKEENLDKDFLKLKIISKWIVKSEYKKEEIIKKVYHYILENLKYDENIQKWNYNIFSGIKTFKDKVWVCQWYVELFAIMLGFNNIKADIIKWDVINSQDFPNIWHAWARIDNLYYDPTFDDPIGTKKTRKFEEYNYYKIPKDLFYTNRFDFWKTPEFLKKINIEKRQKYVEKNIYNIYDKYKNDSYNILKIVKLKKELWLKAEQEISIENIVKKFWFYKMDKNWKINIDWKEKYIEKMNYFEISDKNINDFLHQIKFDLENYKIFQTDDSKFLISNDYKFR